MLTSRLPAVPKKDAAAYIRGVLKAAPYGVEPTADVLVGDGNLFDVPHVGTAKEPRSCLHAGRLKSRPLQRGMHFRRSRRGRQLVDVPLSGRPFISFSSGTALPLQSSVW